MEKMTPRPYQLDAISSCVQHFQTKSKNHAVCILPTGAGKSLVIACVAEQLEGNILVLQPSKEILEQNLAKYRATGNEATIYSANIRRFQKGSCTCFTKCRSIDNRF